MKKIAGFVFLSIAMLLHGCHSKNTSELVEITTNTLTYEFESIQQKTITSTITSLSNKNSISTLTPFPVLTFNQEEILLKELQSNSCKFPCFVSIIPGVTSISEAEAILKKMGASIYGEAMTQGKTTSFLYILPIYDDNAVIPLTFTISLATVDNIIVHQILVSIAPSVPEYFDTYSVRSVFDQLGMPDSILMHIANYDSNTCHDVLLVYDTLGFAAEFRGRSYTKYVCTEQKNIYAMSLNITDTTTGLDIKRGIPSIENYWEPIENVVDISQEDFYDQIMKDETTCFMLLE